MLNGNNSAYARQSRLFLRQAREELAQDDLRQASEKGWGAAAQIVKAAAEQRGLDHRGHAELFMTVDQLWAESQDESLKIQFQVASSLHINFYEGWLTPGQVETGLGQVSQFVDRGEALLSGPSGSL